MIRLRYTGTRAQSFTTGHVGHVEPGGEFDVPPDLAGRFLRRPDIERADGTPDDDGTGAGPGQDDDGTPAPDGTLQGAG